MVAHLLPGIGTMWMYLRGGIALFPSWKPGRQDAEVAGFDLMFVGGIVEHFEIVSIV